MARIARGSEVMAGMEGAGMGMGGDTPLTRKEVRSPPPGLDQALSYDPHGTSGPGQIRTVRALLGTLGTWNPLVCGALASIEFIGIPEYHGPSENPFTSSRTKKNWK